MVVVVRRAPLLGKGGQDMKAYRTYGEVTKVNIEAVEFAYPGFQSFYGMDGWPARWGFSEWLTCKTTHRCILIRLDGTRWLMIQKIRWNPGGAKEFHVRSMDNDDSRIFVVDAREFLGCIPNKCWLSEAA
jgi:hypothetical protein